MNEFEQPLGPCLVDLLRLRKSKRLEGEHLLPIANFIRSGDPGNPRLRYRSKSAFFVFSPMTFQDDQFRLAATDLSNYLACEHLTQLNRKVALGKISKPKWYDPSLDVLIKRGREHEAAYVDYLSTQGLKVVNLNGQPRAAVGEAMKEGVDVLVQANLQEGQWMGYADIVLKVPGKSKFGDWSYEVQDTKLAQNTRAGTILQLCLYTDLISTLQGTVPEKMYVVKPGDNFPKEEYRFAEFHAYYRLIKKNFEQVMGGPELRTYPDPVEQCNICQWWNSLISC